MGFLCVKGFKGQMTPSNRMESSSTFRHRQVGVIGGKVKKVIFVGSLVLLLLAASILYVGARGFASIRRAADYEDNSVHTFAPYEILPIQVKNNVAGRTAAQQPCSDGLYGLLSDSRRNRLPLGRWRVALSVSWRSNNTVI